MFLFDWSEKARLPILCSGRHHRGDMRAKKTSKANGRGQSRHKEGLGLIETVLSSEGAPAIGLFLYTAFSKMMEDVRRSPVYRRISPHLIGTPSILLMRPRISQTELAGYLGCGRATAGLQVKACMRLGWVRRTRSIDDGRTYVLELTEVGRQALTQVSEIVATHESFMCRDLTAAERRVLRALLSKLIVGS